MRARFGARGKLDRPPSVVKKSAEIGGRDHPVNPAWLSVKCYAKLAIYSLIFDIERWDCLRFSAIEGPHGLTPAAAVAEQGAAALRALPELPLYARVDGVVRDGALIVLEVEVLEPALFMEFDPPSAERFADVTAQRLN